MRSFLTYLCLALVCLTTFAGDELKPTPVEKRVKFEGDETSAIVAPKEVSGIGRKEDPFVFTKSTRCILELQGKSQGVSWDIEDAPKDTVLLNNQYPSFSLYQDGLFQIIAHGGEGVYCKVWFSIKSGTDPPTPDPDPVDPKPDPEPNPQPGKLMVIMVKDLSRVSELSPKQLEILLSTKIREYTATHCKTGTDGKTPEFKVFNVDTVIEGESPEIKEGFAAAAKEIKEKNGIAWLAVSNGKSGWSGPLPENEEKTLELLKKYGGE